MPPCENAFFCSTASSPSKPLRAFLRLPVIPPSLPGFRWCHRVCLILQQETLLTLSDRVIISYKKEKVNFWNEGDRLQTSLLVFKNSFSCTKLASRFATERQYSRRSSILQRRDLLIRNNVNAAVLLISLCRCSNSWICRSGTPASAANSDWDSPQVSRLFFSLVWGEAVLSF